MSGPFVSTTGEVRTAYVDSAGEYRDLVGEWFDRWLAQVRADAWDEGNMAGRYEVTEPADVPNPYRQEADQ